MGGGGHVRRRGTADTDGGSLISERIQIALDALAASITDTLADTEAKRLEAEKRSADAAVEANRVRDDLTAQQAALAAAVAENAKLTERLKGLEAGGSGIPLWTPQTVLQPNTPYILPTGQAVRIDVKVPGVTLIGGHVWPVPGGDMSAITANIGGDGLAIEGTRISWDEASAAATDLNLRPGFRTYAKNCSLRLVKFGALNQCVEAMTPCDGLAMDYCEGDGRVRSAFVYVGGGAGVSLFRCKAIDSWGENLVRCSPQDNIIPDRFTVTECDLQNLGSKAVIELRSVTNATIQRNVLRAANGHTCCSVGREVKAGTAPGPGATNVRVFDNECHGGRLEIDPAAENVGMEYNRLYDLRYGTLDKKPERDAYDIAIVLNGKMGLLKNVRLIGNKGFLPGATIKPFFTIGTGGAIPDFYERDNSWVVQP